MCIAFQLCPLIAIADENKKGFGVVVAHLPSRLDHDAQALLHSHVSRVDHKESVDRPTQRASRIVARQRRGFDAREVGNVDDLRWRYAVLLQDAGETACDHADQVGLAEHPVLDCCDGRGCRRTCRARLAGSISHEVLDDHAE